MPEVQTRRFDVKAPQENDAGLPFLTIEGDVMTQRTPHVRAGTSVLDIRTYKNVAGKRDEFVRLMAEETVPMLLHNGIQVVAFGPSIHDEDHALLIRFFGSVDERNEQLARFYGSDEWLDSYDERVMALIETYHTVVIPASREVATALTSVSPVTVIGRIPA